MKRIVLIIGLILLTFSCGCSKKTLPRGLVTYDLPIRPLNEVSIIHIENNYLKPVELNGKLLFSPLEYYSWSNYNNLEVLPGSHDLKFFYYETSGSANHKKMKSSKGTKTIKIPIEAGYYYEVETYIIEDWFSLDINKTFPLIIKNDLKGWTMKTDRVERIHHDSGEKFFSYDFTFIDNKKDEICKSGLVPNFSNDLSRFACNIQYTKEGKKWPIFHKVLVDDVWSSEYKLISKVVFSKDNKYYLYLAKTDDNRWYVIKNGIEKELPDNSENEEVPSYIENLKIISDSVVEYVALYYGGGLIRREEKTFNINPAE